MTIPAIAVFIAVGMAPVVLMFATSFWVEGSLSFTHYLGLWSDNRTLLLLGRSFILASGATLLATLIAVPYAFCLARTDIPAKSVWTWLIFFPLCIPASIHAITWIYLLGDQGLIPELVDGMLHLSFFQGLSIYGLGGAIVVLALAYFPFVVVLTLCGLKNVDQRQEDAARLSYAAPTVMWKVSLPLVRPHIFSGAVFVFLFALFDYGVPALLRVHTYPVEIFAQFSAFYNEAGAAAHALPLVLLAMVLLWLQRHAMGQRAYITMDTGSQAATVHPLGAFRPLALCFMGLVVLFAVALPLATLLKQAGWIDSYKVAILHSAREIAGTVGLAAVASSVIVALSYSLSAVIEARHTRGRTLLDYLSFLPLAFPAVMIGIGAIHFWNRPWTAFIYQSALILIIVYAARFIPIAVRALSAGIRQVGPSLLEAGMLCEGRWWRRWWRIERPLAARGIAAAWVIVFFLCMGELGATLLVIPPGEGSIVLKIYTLMHYGANQVVAALSLILVAVNLTAAIAVVSLFRRGYVYRSVQFEPGRFQ